MPKKIDVETSGATPPRRFFNRAAGRAFEVSAEADTAEIVIYDEIGYWGITASDVRRRLDGITASAITVRLNSPGGDVFDGIAIHNDLADHPAHVTVEVSGLAASAASVIAMAGDRITIAGNAFLMIHNAWARMAGDKTEMSKVAAVLGQIDEALARTYAARSGLAIEDITAMMADETWLDGAAAVEKGFADTVTAPIEAKAKFDLSVFNNVPAGLGAAVSEETPWQTRRDAEHWLTRDAGLSRSQARTLMEACARNPAVTRDADADMLAALSRLTATLKNEEN